MPPDFHLGGKRVQEGSLWNLGENSLPREKTNMT